MLQERALAHAIILQAIQDVKVLMRADQRMRVVAGSKEQLAILISRAPDDSLEARYKITYREGYDAACFLLGVQSHKEMHEFWFRVAGIGDNQRMRDVVIGVYPEMMPFVIKQNDPNIGKRTT